MDPLVQKGIDCKWLFDTKEEAYEAMAKALESPDIYNITSNGNTGFAMRFPWCSGVSGEMQLVGNKYQARIRVYVSTEPSHPVEPANPYGIPLSFQKATFRA